MAGVNGYKRCKCRDENGRELGATCPKLHRAGSDSWNPSHGTWYGKQDVRTDPGLRLPRVTLRQGGFATKDEMTEWFEAAMRLLEIPDKSAMGHQARLEILDIVKAARRAGAPLPSTDDIKRRYQMGIAFNPGTTGSYLLAWLDAREQARDLAATTLHGYKRTIRKLFLPALGDIPLDKLRSDHVLAVLASLDAEAERIRTARISPDPVVRKSVAGMRPPGQATKARYLAVLRAALGKAVKDKILAGNAAAVSVGQDSDVALARVWSPERERAWRRDYEARLEALGESPTRQEKFAIWHSLAARPGPVTVWMPSHLGRFLDAAADDRLHALFCIIGYCGLRRGEACGLAWSEVDLDGKYAMIDRQIVQVGWKTVTGAPKTRASRSHVTLGPETVAALRAWRKQQLSERMAWGPAWQDTGLVFTREDGSAYHPDYLTKRLQQLAFGADLPPVRLHDLRHGAATMALAGGADTTAVSRMLRHASVRITADTYAEILPALAAEVAEKVDAMVPRTRRAAGASNTGGLPTVSLDRTERDS